MTGALTPLTPREFAERALVGTLLWQPGRTIDIAEWLEPNDFRNPANAAVYRHVRDMVAEAMAQVPWDWMEYDRPGSARTDAQASLDAARWIAVELAGMRASPEDWVDIDVDTRRQMSANEVAQYAAEFPGLLQRLTAAERLEIDSVLPLAARNAYAVPGVDPVSLFERINASAEPGDRFITAPLLHTLMATAPGGSAVQPEVYAQMVLEASIRREVQHAGMQVAQRADLETSAVLAAVQTALNRVDAARQRWSAVTGDHAIAIALDPPATRSLHAVVEPVEPVEPESVTSRLDLLAPPPDAQQLTAAEETVVASVLIRPDTLGRLIDRLYPEDFQKAELGNTYRAAIEVHAGAHTTGRRVDPVTVAWEQQRHQAQHGPGVDVAGLMRIVERGPTVDLEYAADVVMRGRLARLTADAAAAVQQAAQHPGLQPADVLHTTHLAFDAVRATAGRMSGEAGISTRLAGLDSGPAEQPSTMAGAVHSSAQIIHLRRRSTDLRNAVVGNVATPD
ncbi:MAG TPA: DnaB-like helicase N-terminal domain-containing protein, partial [Pseudonocardiaceae bacterium]|nr:DnaB-like helicase N-terminal domain-containing protein [Pseudonocardiaceae bacterium]